MSIEIDGVVHQGAFTEAQLAGDAAVIVRLARAPRSIRAFDVDGLERRCVERRAAEIRDAVLVSFRLAPDSSRGAASSV